MKRINKEIYDERPGFVRILLRIEHYCGACGGRIGRFERTCHTCGEPVEVGRR